MDEDSTKIFAPAGNAREPIRERQRQTGGEKNTKNGSDEGAEGVHETKPKTEESEAHDDENKDEVEEGHILKISKCLISNIKNDTRCT